MFSTLTPNYNIVDHVPPIIYPLISYSILNLQGNYTVYILNELFNCRLNTNVVPHNTFITFNQKYELSFRLVTLLGDYFKQF